MISMINFDLSKVPNLPYLKRDQSTINFFGLGQDMKIIAQLLEFIRSRGITDHASEYDQLTGFLNLFSFLTSVGALGVFVVAVLTGQDTIYLGISLMVFGTYFSILILHHFHCKRTVRLLFGAIVPLWLVFAILSIGGNFGQALGFASNIVITFLLFRESPRFRNILVVYNIFLYLLPTLYILNWEPWFGVRDVPGDEIVVFLMCLLWISVVFAIYEYKTTSILALKEKELAARTRELEQFVYLASHDMKAPVRNILGILELFKANLEDKEYQNLGLLVTHLKASANNLNELIHSVLEMSKYNAIDPSTFEPVDLNTELEKALFNLQTDIKERKAEISMDPLPTFLANKGDFALVFQNFIQNGLKYNESEVPLIGISFKEYDRFHQICIRDNGIGIKEEHHKEIFELFKRVHTGGDYSGTGLGLGLCKKIIEKYQGEVRVESVEGEFTNFCIILPHKSKDGVEDILVNPLREFLKVPEEGLN